MICEHAAWKNGAHFALAPQHIQRAKMSARRQFQPGRQAFGVRELAPAFTGFAPTPKVAAHRPAAAEQLRSLQNRFCPGRPCE